MTLQPSPAPCADRASPGLLRLFGPPVLQAADAEHPLRAEQPMRLLGVLAASGEPWPRERLAALFWPEDSAEAARSNLRKTVFRLRQWLQARGLHWDAEGPLLRWQTPTDVARLQAACASGQALEAIALVRGPLLHGLDGGSAAFQDWLDAERQRWAARWRTLVLSQVASGPSPALLGWTARLLEDDPLDETVTRAHVQLLVLDGQRAQARRVHARWQALMRDELGLDPGSASWAPPLLGPQTTPEPVPGADARADPPEPAAAQLPQYLTPLVGRQRQLEHLRQWLAAPGGLLTLVGPPGSGKTRLAAEALRDPRLARRTAFVALDRLPAHPATDEPAASPDDGLTPWIAQSLGLALVEGARRFDRLVAALRADRRVLLLDSFDHRLGDLGWLAHLTRTPGIHVLVTSRVRLPFPEAEELRLDGLPVEREAADAREPGSLAGDSPALQLFVQRCRRLAPDERSAADRLCRLLQGQPLAIELAARTCRALPVAEVLRTLQDDLAQLAAHAPDLPPRQRSLRAAFDAHWLQLPTALQRVAARLSVLRADFSVATARAVGGATDADLAALCDHHGLRIGSDGTRLHWHPFVREFCHLRLLHEPALAADLQAARRAQCAHFTAQLRRLGAEETRPSRAALQYLAAEAGNLAAAFAEAVALHDVGAQRVLAEALTLHHEFHALCLQGAALLQASDDPHVALRRARLLHWAAPARAEAVAAPAHARLQAAGDSVGLTAAARVRALIAWRRGERVQAEAWCREALSRLPPGAAAERAIVLDGLGLVLRSAGQTAEARAAFAEALALNDAVGNELQAVQNLINLALDACSEDAPRACALAQRALALCESIGFRHYLPHARTAWSLALRAAGQPDPARAAAQAAAAAARASGDAYAECFALVALAQAQAALGDDPGCRETSLRGLGQAWRLGDAGLMQRHLAQAGHPRPEGRTLSQCVHEALAGWSGADAGGWPQAGAG
jgi:DNA-binding SARP family transcriptional activator/tetratricopeptide (TPR) repeat protein